MKQLIMVKQNDQIVTNRDVTDPVNIPAVIEALEKYPESEYAFFLNTYVDGELISAEPIKFADIGNVGKPAEPWQPAEAPPAAPVAPAEVPPAATPPDYKPKAVKIKRSGKK